MADKKVLITAVVDHPKYYRKDGEGNLALIPKGTELECTELDVFNSRGKLVIKKEPKKLKTGKKASKE